MVAALVVATAVVVTQVAAIVAVTTVARPLAAIAARAATLAVVMVVASVRLIVRRALLMHRLRRLNRQRVLLIAHRQNSNVSVRTALRVLALIVVRHVSAVTVQRLATAMTVAPRALVVTQHRVVNSVIVLSALTRHVMIVQHRALATTAQHRASVTTAPHRALALIVRLLRIVVTVALQIVNHVRHGATAPRRVVNLRHVRNALSAHRSMRRSSVPSAWTPHRVVRVASSRMTCVPSDAATRLPVRR